MNVDPETGIYVCDVDNLYIRNNYFKNLAMQIEVESYGNTSVKNVYIYNNIMYNVGVTSGDFYGSGIRFSGLTSAPATNINIINNTLVANPENRVTMIGIWMPTIGDARNIIIRNNIIQGFKYASIFAAGGKSTDSLIISDPVKYAGIITTPVIFDSVFVENNILYQNAIPGFTWAIDNLPYYTNIDLPLHNIQQNNIQKDPMFISATDFHLKNQSPGIGQGIPTSWITKDFEDFDIFTPPNIGAYGGSIRTIIPPTKNLKNEILVYPNPTVDHISMMFKDSSIIPTSVQVYDFAGKLMIDKKINSIDGSNGTYNLSFDLSSGIYIIRVMNKNIIMFTTKIIVSK